MTNIIDELINNKIINYSSVNEYTLKSGIKSNIYIDIRKAISLPILQKNICNLYCEKINANYFESFDYICGVPDGAVPLASMLSYILSKPLLMLRKNQKKHGMGKLIEGEYKKNSKVLVIEDIVTTGQSVVDCVEKLREHNLNPVNIMCLVKRLNLSDVEIFHQTKSIPIISLIKMSDIIFKLKLSKSKLCVAADVSNMKTLEKVIKKVSPYASIIKLHIDAINDFVPESNNMENTRNNNFVPEEQNSIQKLISWKDRYGVLLWEDRKFADIAHITKNQINNGIHKIAKWADIVSVHCISGPEILNTTYPCKIFVIGQMSSCNTLADSEYLNKVLTIAESHNKETHIINNPVLSPDILSPYKTVIGIITQTNISTNLLKIVPGINNNKQKDSDQQYRNVQNVKDWADIIVVGRGIVNNIDLEEREFKQLCENYMI